MAGFAAVISAVGSSLRFSGRRWLRRLKALEEAGFKPPAARSIDIWRNLLSWARDTYSADEGMTAVSLPYATTETVKAGSIHHAYNVAIG
jgi:hypothetical protein